MSGGSSQPQTTTQSTTPWAGQQPYLTDVMRQAQSQYYGPGPQYYGGPTVAQPGADTQQAQQMLRSYAGGAGQQTANNALNASNFLTSGAVLDPSTNPYLRAATDAAMQPVIDSYTQQVLPQIRGGAVKAGQFGGTRQGIAEGLAAQGLTRTLADTSSTMYSNNYQAGLQSMGQGLALAPQTLQAGQMPSIAMDSIGRQLQAQDQANINADVDRWNFGQNLQPQKLAQYANLVSGNYGGQTVGTQPGPRSNPLGAALGGAAMGSTFGPWGTAIGGGLGLLSSFL